MRSKFPWRFIFYIGLLLYLAGDLLFFRGPIRQKVDHRRSIKEMSENFENGNWVGIVNGEPITTAQLDLATQLAIYRQGKTREDVSDASYRITRRATLQHLVNDTLVRQYAQGDGWKASEAEVARRIESFRSQFPPDTNFAVYDKGQGFDGAERDELLRRMANQEAWIEHKIKEGMTSITDQQVREFYEANRQTGKGFTNPLRMRARHIFISTVKENSPAREQLIREIRAQVNDENFAELAKKYSEDERSKLKGGDLGWFSDRGIPEDFFSAVKALPVGELSQPIQTKLGWHLVEIQERAEEEMLPFETVEADIRIYLENELRASLVDELVRRYRRVAIIRIFPDNL